MMRFPTCPPKVHHFTDFAFKFLDTNRSFLSPNSCDWDFLVTILWRSFNVQVIKKYFLIYHDASRFYLKSILSYTDLERFFYSRKLSSTEKFNTPVQFPLEGLDITRFTTPNTKGCTYDLVGVVNHHSLTANSGHYTAFCKHPFSGMWFKFNDASAEKIQEELVVSSDVYMLFYKQRS